MSIRIFVSVLCAVFMMNALLTTKSHASDVFVLTPELPNFNFLVKRYDASGTFLNDIPIPTDLNLSAALGGEAIEIGGDGNLYIPTTNSLEPGSVSISRFSPGGTYLGPYISDAGPVVLELAFAPNNELFVLGLDNQNTFGFVIQRYDSNGSFLNSIDLPSGLVPALGGEAVDVGPDGNLYVPTFGALTPDPVGISRFTPDGTYLGEFVSDNSLRYFDIAFGPSGELYAYGIDALISGAPLIKRYNSTGQFIDSFTFPEDRGLTTGGEVIEIDSDGVVYIPSAAVPTFENIGISTFQPDGAYLGEFINTTGIAPYAIAFSNAVEIVPGDTDGDGDVDDADLGTAFSNYTGALAPGTGGRSASDGDTDGDADVDDADLGTSFSNYTGALVPSARVPEPAAGVALMIGLACARRRRSA